MASGGGKFRRSWRSRLNVGAAASAVLVVFAIQAAPFGVADPGPSGGDRSNGGAGDNASYIVTFKSGTSPREQQERRADVTSSGGEVSQTYSHALRGFAADMDAQTVAELRSDPDVSAVALDLPVAASGGVENPAPWHLDRIDQRGSALNNSFSYEVDGAGITVFVIDSGVRNDHVEFGGRVAPGFDAITTGGTGFNDCNGHGTFTAGAVGSASYGVAKAVTLVPVRVLDCDGRGDSSQVIAGLEWVMAHKVPGRSVINMSLGGPKNFLLEQAADTAIAAGVPVVAAAGNDSSDACNFSPAGDTNAITVGATDSGDSRASFSNFGHCVDLFAPGVDVVSTWPTSNNSLAQGSGTSFAAPQVAGAVATILQGAPGASPASVRSELGSLMTIGALSNLSGSPNALLYAPPRHRLAGVGSATTAAFLVNLAADSAALTVNGAPEVDAFQTSGSTSIAVQDPATLPACSIPRPTSQGLARAALLTSLSAGNGCLHFAEAEHLDLAPANPGLVYVPFARENVTYAVSGNSSLPLDLTLDDLRSLYQCPEGFAFRPMLPPVGSGLREFWLAQMYPGGTPSPIPSCVQDGSDENAATISPNSATGVNNIELVPYSVAQWAGQTADIYSNRRGQSRIGQVNGQSPFGATFPIQRDLYIVIPQSSAATTPASVADIRTRTVFVGSGSPLCRAVAGPLGVRAGFRPHPDCGTTSLQTP